MSDYSAAGPPQSYHQSSAFAAALQRAKQIAAKINPSSGGAGDANRPLKRSIDESSEQEPEPKKLVGLDYGNNPQPNIPPKSGVAPGAAATRAAHLGLAGGAGPPPLHGPVINEDIKVPDKMVGLIIGRGGEQITRLQAEAGCKIQMAADSCGQPDRLCSLSGSRDAIQRAKDLIYNIVHTHQRLNDSSPTNSSMHNNSNSSEFLGMGAQSGAGGGVTHVTMMVPGPKVGLIIGKGGETIKQLQEKSGAKMVVIQEGPNPEQEKPLRISGDPQKVEYAKQLVYDLIAEKEMQNYRGGAGGAGNRGGPPGGGPPGRGGNDSRNSGSNFGSNDGSDFGGGGSNGDGVEVQVPRAAVGVVIGKGGDMIKKIQAETGARVQFQQGRDDGPGDRRCLLTGKPQNVESARQRIEDLIDSVHRRDNESGSGGGRNNRNRNNDYNNGGGGGGGGGGNHRNGGNNSGNGGYGGGGGGGGGGGNQWNGNQGSNASQIEVTFQVPTYKCGVIIGRGGETIKQINQQSGAYCELDRRAPQGNGQEKTFTIRGDVECVENAKRIISDKIQMPLYFTTSNNSAPNMPPSGGGNSGGGGGGMNPSSIPTAYPGMGPQQGYNPQQPWSAPAAPGQDTPSAAYSQQWSQQAAATAAPVQINPQTGQPDYSKQWAEYYRSLGMHREADMIEQQAKSGVVTQTQGPVTPAGAVGGQTPTPQTIASANGTTNASATSATAAGVVAGGGQPSAQPDYSAQWAEYYRSIGKVKEAEMIEVQMKSKTSAPAVPPAAATVSATLPTASNATATPQTAASVSQFANYAAYGGYYAQSQQPALAGATSATNAPAPQNQYSFPGYGGAYNQQQGGSSD